MSITKYLIVIGGGILQYQTLVECEKMGIGIILVDRDKDCYCASRNKNGYFINADIKDPYEVLSQVNDFINSNKDLNIAGVYTQGCDCAYTVAFVAEKLHLPNIGSQIAYRCSNKAVMRKFLEKNNILQPNYFIVRETMGDLADSITAYPCVYKSTDNCASRGVTIVRDRKYAIEAYKNALKNNIRDNKVIVEEFIEGEEYSVDTIVYKNTVYPAGISDRVFLNKENYAVQDGSLTPSQLPEEIQNNMYQVMQNCANAIGIEWGAFKGDLLLGKDGKIYVIEVTARLSGGFDSQYRKPYSFGINLIKATIDLACGKELDQDDITPKWLKYSQTFSIFPKPGVIKEIKGEEELRNIPGIKQVFFTKHIGSLVEYKTCADRVVHIIACADTYEELQDTINKARKTLEIVTE